MMSPPPFKRKKTDETDLQIHSHGNYNNYDDDDDDISDSELIRASQMVESRYVNSAAISSTHNLNRTAATAAHNQSSFASQLYHNPQLEHTLDGSDAHQLAQEIRALKSDNYQKDGEVKILRDRLKKSEFELTKLRNDKMELAKKFTLQSDETTKAYRKQLESKELEVQFKTQEILELTMKYKLLESKMRKSATTTTTGTGEPLKQVQNMQQYMGAEKGGFNAEPIFEPKRAPKSRNLRLKAARSHGNALKEALINFLIVDSSDGKTLLDKVSFVSQDGLVKVVYFFIDLFKYCMSVFEVASELKLAKLLTFLKELVAEFNSLESRNSRDIGKINAYLRTNVSLIGHLLGQIDAFLVKLSLTFANKNANGLSSLAIDIFLYFLLLESKLLKLLRCENKSDTAANAAEVDKFRRSFEARRLNLFHLVNHLSRIRPSMHLFASVVNIVNALEAHNEAELVELLHNFNADVRLGSLIEHSSTQLGPSHAINASSLASILSLSTFDSCSSAGGNLVCLLTVFFEKLTKFLIDDVYVSDMRSFSGLNEFLSSYMSYVELITLHKAHLNASCACFKEILFCFLILCDYVFNETFLNKRENVHRAELCMGDALLMLHNRALAVFIKLNQQLSCAGVEENLFEAILKDDYRFKNLVCLMHLVDTHMSANHSAYLNFASLKAAFSRLSYFDI
jgi:hypothetical protein